MYSIVPESRLQVLAVLLAATADSPPGRIRPMWYFAQVIQTAHKLHRQLGIRLDYAEAAKLFVRRLDETSIHISRGVEANFADPTDDRGRRIQSAIDEHRARLASNSNRICSRKRRAWWAPKDL
jgi:hypothetical protein